MKTLTESLKTALNEHLGTFDGLLNICEYCAQVIYSACNGAAIEPGAEYNIDIDREDFVEIPNVFFEVIKFSLIMCEADRAAEYVPMSKLNPKTMLFKNITVNVYINYKEEIEPYKICEGLLHELTHAYTDYQMQLKGTEYFTQLAEFYKKTDYDSNIESLRNQIRQALYLTLGVEKQAFLAQFSAELELSKQPIYTPIDAMEVLRKTDVYSFYCDMRSYIEQYKKGDLEQSDIDTITDEYNKISGTHLSSNKVFKKLEFLMKKAIKKFDDVIRKLCFERFS